MLELERKISQRVKKQMEKTQKEYYLREQMKAIQRNWVKKKAEPVRQRNCASSLSESDAPEGVKEKREGDRPAGENAGYICRGRSVIRTYVEWLLALPWTYETEDWLDIRRAEKFWMKIITDWKSQKNGCSNIWPSSKWSKS